MKKGHILSKGLCFKTILNSEGTLNRKGTMVLRTLLIPNGQKRVEKGEGLVNTSRRREKRGKTQEASTVNFSVPQKTVVISNLNFISQNLKFKLNK
ncbi:hypothetical protein MtrunA17_Chr4g0008371 [Medicago truncatula]|uniref:Uncharacterized protein n=1 Tax=Medicago truncatula TaxID=3880 RepID=A0A396I2M0_MEDTR|nr:hypothetical protein MtrunA17_Chr4g0008371 [Medicago truncatula]